MSRLQKTALLAAVVLSLDQLTKFWAVKSLILGQSVPVLPGIFHLTLTYNTGVAFGLLAKAGSWVAIAALAALAILAVGFMRSNAWEEVQGWRSHVAVWTMALVLGGAVGNLIDRWRVGAVIDFLDFRIWPVFNLADSAITIGAGFMVLMLWKKP